MNIKILGTSLKKDEVRFTSGFGEAKGIWHGGGAAAPAGVYEVEFELSSLFMRWVDIVPADTDDFEIRMDGDTVVLTGILENIEEDGTAFLRLGQELIMFECLGEPMALGGFVEVRTREIMLYPVKL